jgi:hypothetical protein
MGPISFDAKDVLVLVFRHSHGGKISHLWGAFRIFDVGSYTQTTEEKFPLLVDN